MAQYDLGKFRTLFLAGERADPDTIQWAERLYTEHRIPFVNTTAMSIEEIAAAIMHRTGIRRRAF